MADLIRSEGVQRVREPAQNEGRVDADIPDASISRRFREAAIDPRDGIPLADYEPTLHPRGGRRSASTTFDRSTLAMTGKNWGAYRTDPASDTIHRKPSGLNSISSTPGAKP